MHAHLQLVHLLLDAAVEQLAEGSVVVVRCEHEADHLGHLAPVALAQAGVAHRGDERQVHFELLEFLLGAVGHLQRLPQLRPSRDPCGAEPSGQCHGG